MELRDLEYFAAIAEYGHLGRAAEALGLSQPALSKCLRRLEKAVDAKLVMRTPKGVALTSVGAALRTHAKRLSLSLTDVVHEAADLSQGVPAICTLAVERGRAIISCRRRAAPC